jgi:type I restriction enzyme S subunit
MSSKKKTAATEDDGKPAMTPKLRFPEFRDSEGWDTKPGDELFEQINNRDAPTGLPILAITQEHGAIPRDLIDYHVSVTDKSVETYKEVRPGDFIISLRSFQGGIEYSNYHGICSPAYVILRKRAELSDLFYKQHFKSHSFIQQLTKNLEGLRDGKMVSYKQFSELQLLNPSPPEQQKIAECLSSVDELMAAQSRKLDSLKTHKKGLMQQLFPREGETTPTHRFPEFQRAGEWKIFPLAALADKIMVGIASAATHAYRETGVPMLRNQNIKEGKIDDSSLLFIDPVYEAAHKGKRLRAGDVITVRTGYPGLSAVVTERYHNAQCFTSLITRPKKNVLDADYLCAFINSEIGKRFILGAEAGGAQKNVNAGALEALSVYLPELEEQQRIASCLSSLDALITAETQKLEALKTHKKALMQQLFPSPEEIES